MKSLLWSVLIIVIAIIPITYMVSVDPIEIQELSVTPFNLAEIDFPLEAFTNDVRLLDMKVENTFNDLSERERVGQLFMPAVGSNGLSFETVRLLAESGEISGFMVLGRNVSDAQIRQLKTILEEVHGVAPLVSLDAEPSLLSSRVSGATAQSTNSYNSEPSSKAIGEEISKLLVEKGYNVNFAPVYDTNANSSVIGSRSYGPTTDIASLLGNAFVNGSLKYNIATTAKHFPGHGQVVGDSHKILPTIKGSLSELDAFKSAIDHEVPLIMVGHLNIDTPELSTEGLPATLSRDVMSDLLRDDLGFKGVVITDAFNMNALDGFGSRENSKELLSIESGADIVLMPEGSISGHITKIIEKMNQNPAYKSMIEEKAKRVIKLRHTLQ